MQVNLEPLRISYDTYTGNGILNRTDSFPNGAWIRLRNAAVSADSECKITKEKIVLEWSGLLTLLREFSPLQRTLGFFFEPDDSSRSRIQVFIEEYRRVSQARNGISIGLSEAEIDLKLGELGWDFSKRQLTDYQKLNISRLAGLAHGANFSVPGAGKTTVTFALSLILQRSDTSVLVVAPKSAFPAWHEVIGECIRDNAPPESSDLFVTLTGGVNAISEALSNRPRRAIISYDQLTRANEQIALHLSRNKVHLILDEAHRMKAGYGSQRGSALLGMGYLAVRRDILTGTPMPQSPSDLQSQTNFLWPGMGFGDRIALGETPRSVLTNLYVRTTKKDLQLPPRKANFVPVTMADAHLAFYCIVRDEFRRQVSELRACSAFDIVAARKSVIRLLQVSSNPLVAIEKMSLNFPRDIPAIADAVIQEGPSTKIRAVCNKARELAIQGRKVIIWTIFTDTINRLNNLLPDLNPVVIYGQTPSGDAEDEDTREGKLEQFRNDPRVFVLIANPAATSEGISLHMHCHDAIYLDRSYNATHFLQSIDRIHRLGLPRHVETNIWIFQNQTPKGIGSVDYSVSRRLAAKIREMYKLLEDPDLHELALDEETAPIPIEEGVDLQDIDDLIREIEGRAEHINDELP